MPSFGVLADTKRDGLADEGETAYEQKLGDRTCRHPDRGTSSWNAFGKRVAD
jgi:hypothetical protein